MAAQLIDGRAAAQEIRQKLKERVAKLKAEGINPGLTAVLVGDDPASQVYVRMKQKACEQTGIYSQVFNLPKETGQQELLGLIDQLNSDRRISGILVQLPLPDGYDEEEVIGRIELGKDVDGFHPQTVGRLVLGQDSFLPCTPAGIIDLVKRQGVEIASKKVVIVGRSNIVGKPAALLFLRENATVTICHSRTVNLAEECRQADILVAAVGRPEMIKADWVKPGATVIDVGINRTDQGLVGDVDFAKVKEVAGAITPVPGGVGPMTIAKLLENTVRAAEQLSGTME